MSRNIYGSKDLLEFFFLEKSLCFCRIFFVGISKAHAKEFPAHLTASRNLSWKYPNNAPEKFWLGLCSYTQRNLLEILLNKTEIRLYLPFSD